MKESRRYLFWLSAASIIMCSFSSCRTNSHVSAGSAGGYLIDKAGVLRVREATQIDSLLEAFTRQDSIEIMIYLGKTTGGREFPLFANDVYDNSRLNRNRSQRCLLLLITIADNRVGAVIGKGLREKISNEECARVFNEDIMPSFGKHDYYEGLKKGIQATIDIIKER